MQEVRLYLDGLMKLDKEYTYIYVCPTTDTPVSKDMVFHNGGVCHVCGDEESYLSHAIKVTGRWSRPDFFARLRLKKATFLRKDEEDKVWDTLKK